ncbi:hypothetical protein HFU84_12115 [Acidithiobacillus sp. CV18-2]|nr:hypothetical protein [Acidithiobacillus sp. CV18-3]MBU2756021.1 hypothetical protein [Acidithiobacillus sp. BN09-2]MBU2778232.1 hypothetical protein [Acidithiobacillus sp. CV18-2]MBU2799105.1 hypothetical protein [Acidithiobacillus sp. VAN18-4]
MKRLDDAEAWLALHDPDYRQARRSWCAAQRAITFPPVFFEDLPWVAEPAAMPEDDAGVVDRLGGILAPTRETLRLLSRGYTTREVALERRITQRAVQKTISSIRTAYTPAGFRAALRGAA